MPTIDELEKEALQDLSIDILEIQEGLQANGLKKIKWSKYLFDEEKISSQMEEMLAEMYRKKFKYYLYDDPLKIEKKNVDIWVKGDEEYKKAEKLYKTQKSKEKFVNAVINALEQQSFSYNSIIKHMIFQAGGNG